MKKVISVLLAVIMLFSALAISSTAADDKTYQPKVPRQLRSTMIL